MIKSTMIARLDGTEHPIEKYGSGKYTNSNKALCSLRPSMIKQFVCSPISTETYTN